MFISIFYYVLIFEDGLSLWGHTWFLASFPCWVPLLYFLVPPFCLNKCSQFSINLFLSLFVISTSNFLEYMNIEVIITLQSPSAVSHFWYIWVLSWVLCFFPILIAKFLYLFHNSLCWCTTVELSCQADLVVSGDYGNEDSI